MRTFSSPICYHKDLPDWLCALAETPPMQRIREVGMNCGCEYSGFPRFRGLRYSRHDHSLGTALIVWHFTCDRTQTIAALFHDIATPVFAHTIDFLNGDYMQQTSTEASTEAMIRSSPEIAALLTLYGIPLENVTDYHRYPIADNDSPRLSSDRLEYTLGNALRYGFAGPEELQACYDDLCVTTAEDGQPELAFSTLEYADTFAQAMLQCSRVYVSDPDRYLMQMLSELMAMALNLGVIDRNDLYSTEPQVISALTESFEIHAAWERFRALHEMVTEADQAPIALRRTVFSKKRYIDPLVAGQGRLSSLSPDFRRTLGNFLAEPQDHWLYGR